MSHAQSLCTMQSQDASGESLPRSRLLRQSQWIPLLSSSLLCFLRHRTHHCPTECDIPSLPCTHQIPLPLPTHLLRHCYLSPGWKGAGRWEMKGREDHYAFPLMDGFETLPNVFHNTHAFVFNEQIFLLYPLTFLYSLSITYFSPRLLSQLGIKLLPWRKWRAGWFGWWCRGTSSWDPDV